MDFVATYPNALTSTVFLPVKLAMVLRDDRMAIEAAVKTCNGVTPENARIVLIRNSLHMGELYLSEAFLPLARETEGMEIVSDCQPLPFDEGGNLLIWNDKEDEQ